MRQKCASEIKLVIKKTRYFTKSGLYEIPNQQC